MRRRTWWLWPLAVGVAWIALVASGSDPRTALAAPLQALQGSPWFAAALLAAYLLRAVVLLPSTLLTVLAGVTLGPFWGALVATLGATASALAAYALARAARPRRADVGEDATDEAADDATARAGALGARLGGLGQRLRGDAFTATLIARLALLPGDVVNVVAGASRVPWRPFAAATALGGTPGLLAAVLAGASLDGSLEAGTVTVDPSALAASLALALVAAGVAAWARRRAR